MPLGYNVPQDNPIDFEALYHAEVAQSRQHIPEPPSMPDTVPYIEPVAVPTVNFQRRSLSTAKINGNIVIVTQGINDDDFTLFPIGNPINTSGRDSKETLQPIDHSRYDPYNGQTSTMFGDKLSTYLLGGCAGILALIFTVMLTSSGKSPAQQAVAPYQPTPYTIETEKCKPGGFLWTGEECNRTTERGIR